MKKTLALALALFIILSLAACTTTTTPTTMQTTKGTTASSPSTTATTATTAPAEKLTFEVWHIETNPVEAKTIDDSFARFIKDNPRVEKIVTVPTENAPYKTKLKVAIAANNLPDLFIHWSGGPMNAYVDAGLLADVTEYMNKENYKDMYLDAAISQCYYKDKMWAVPIEDVTVAMVFYNKKIFAAQNIQIPKTLTEFEAVCEKLKAAGIVPIALANKEKHLASIIYMHLVDRFGGSDVFKNAAGRINNGTFESPAYVYAGQKSQEWVNKKYFNEGFNGLSNGAGQDRALLYSGNAAMLVMGSWVISQIINENPNFLNDVDAFPFPAIEGGKGDPTAVVGTVGNNFYSISAKCKAPDLAFKAITYLLDDIAIKERITQGKLPPIKGIETMVTRPIQKTMLDIVNNASNVQLWYDQYLPPELGELHKDICQEIFGLTLTPEQANKKMQEGLAAYYK